MIAHRHPVNYSFREYVTHDDDSNTKHEYLDGQIYAMAGGTPEHSALAASVTAHVWNAVRGGPCRIHTSDLRVRVTETGLATYPDVAVVCGPWERDAEDANTVVNPVIVVEVLSPSTEAYDRGEKLEHYKRIPTLRACLLVATDRREIDLWTRSSSAFDAWTRTVIGSGGEVVITDPAIRFAVDAAYDDASEPG